MCRKQRRYPAACAPRRSIVRFPRTSERRGPESILFPAAGRLARFGGADAEEAGEGRHPTSALREKKDKEEKKNKLVHVGAASRCVTPTWILIGLHRKHRKWCRPGSSTSYPQRLTRTHRPAQLVISVPTPPVAARAGL